MVVYFLFKNNSIFAAKKVVMWCLVSQFSRLYDFHGKTSPLPFVGNLFIAIYQHVRIPNRKACICQNMWFHII